MPADGIVIGLDVNALARVAEVIPVEQHRAERSEQPVRDVARAGGVVILFSGSAQPSAETPVRSTSIGCVAAGSVSSTVRTAAGNAAQTLELGV